MRRTGSTAQVALYGRKESASQVNIRSTHCCYLAELLVLLLVFSVGDGVTVSRGAQSSITSYSSIHDWLPNEINGSQAKSPLVLIQYGHFHKTVGSLGMWVFKCPAAVADGEGAFASHSVACKSSLPTDVGRSTFCRSCAKRPKSFRPAAIPHQDRSSH